MWDWKFSAQIRKRFLLFFNTFGPKISNPTIMEKFHNWLWSEKWQIHVKLGYKNWRNVYLGHYCRVNFLFRGVFESGWRGVRSLLKPSSAFLVNKIYQFFSKPAKKFADGVRPATRGGRLWGYSAPRNPKKCVIFIVKNLFCLGIYNFCQKIHRKY